MYLLKFFIIHALFSNSETNTVQINNDVEIFNNTNSSALEDIMNGAVATEDMFPYMVSIQTRSRQHTCGGTLITKYHILTAAHCTFKKIREEQFNPNELRIRIGAVNLRNPPDVLAKIIWIKIHEGYQKMPINNDVAVIKVDRELISDESKLLPLSSSFIRPSSVQGKCTTVGWGRLGPSPFSFGLDSSLKLSNSSLSISDTTENAYVSNSTLTVLYTREYDNESSESTEEEIVAGDIVLRYTLLPLQKAEECAKDYEAGLTDDVICAGERNSGTDTCKGDSGGPLICDGKIEGIVSFGDGCENPEHLGVYTRVYIHLKWIQQQILTNSEQIVQRNLYFIFLCIILIINI